MSACLPVPEMHAGVLVAWLGCLIGVLNSDEMIPPCDPGNPCHVRICARARAALPSRVELVSEDGGSHDGDGDGLHWLEDGGEQRASPVDAPDLQSKRNPGCHQTLPSMIHSNARRRRFQFSLDSHSTTQELRCTCIHVDCWCFTTYSV